MMQPRNRLSRLDRAKETKTRGKGLADMINETAATRAKDPPRKATAEVVVPPAKPVELTPKPAKAAPAKPPPAPAPPLLPQQWHEEMLGWRGHGPRPPSSYDDGVRYETIHEYDPLEHVLEEEEYN